ncbi:MAG TPA: acyl-CoA dehydrogenase, partial [Nevskiaceae bacterium]|nr:acyl-CoA dehydrogenase [Nevskiaceae bacterium]
HYEPTLVRTRAARNADGWVLNGAKTVVHNAAHADFFLVSARTSSANSAADGITLFRVPRDAKGLNVRDYPRIDGGHAGELGLSNVVLGSDAMVGPLDGGAALLADATAWGLLALCAESVGAMNTARKDTVEYLQTRKQFGVAIGSFQALQHRMVDLMIDIEQARSAVTNAAAAMTRDPWTRDRALAAAKYTIGHTGTHVAEECVQMHGGIGMTWELPLSHYAKRLVMIDHELGDEDHHLQRFIELGRQAHGTAAAA